MRTTLALALRGARCSLWRSRSASVAWPWLAPARRSARVHECKGTNRQKGFFVVVNCRVLWWVVKDHHALILIGAWCCRFAIYDETNIYQNPLILIGGWWYIFVPFGFLFFIFYFYILFLFFIYFSTELFFMISSCDFANYHGLCLWADRGIVHPYTPFTSQLFVKLSLFCECRNKGMVYLCGVPSVERM